MSAPTDRPNDPNSASFYAPRGARAARLPPADMVPVSVPEESGESRNALVASEPFEGDLAVQRLRARRALDPDYVPTPPPALRQRSALAVFGRLLMVTLAAAVIALVAIGQFPFPTFLQQTISNRPAELASLSSRAAPTPTQRADAEVPVLLVRASRGTSGQPAPLGVSVQGRADAARILITGLPASMTLSTGTTVGDAWQVPATESVLANTWIIPPNDFVGVIDLVAELHLADDTIAQRRPIHLEWAASAPVAAAPAAPVAAPAPAASPVAVATATASLPLQREAAPATQETAAPVRQLPRDQVELLVKRGKDFLLNGDIAAARLSLQRAAEANDAEAALALAATYDPVVLRELKVYGVAADVALARSWYEKAASLGSAEAPHRLSVLATATH